MMNAGDPARYELEHRMLPALLHGPEGGQTIAMIAHGQGNILCAMYEMLHRDPDYRCPYPESSFGVSLTEPAPDCQLLTITMPQPQGPTLCHKVVCLYHERDKTAQYYTVQKTMMGTTPMLCGWNAGGTHLNFGTYTEERLQAMLARDAGASEQ